jgi:AraC-like DNA-binding protein
MAKVVINDIAEWRQRARASGYHAARLAMDLAISRTQLGRYTQSVFGRSPQEWLDVQRLNDARERLKTVRCVKAVAFELGFKQISHFTREFKSLHGLTPTAFLAAADFRQSSGSQPFNPS